MTASSESLSLSGSNSGEMRGSVRYEFLENSGKDSVAEGAVGMFSAPGISQPRPLDEHRPRSPMVLDTVVTRPRVISTCIAVFSTGVERKHSFLPVARF